MDLPTFHEAKRYLEDPHACFQLLTLTKHISLSPKYIENLSEGIRNALSDEMSQYSDSVEGVMIAYNNVKVLTSGGIIYEDMPEIHINIKFDVIIFKPMVGSVLQGVVNKVGEQHIGCLVHNCFNASISKPDHVHMSQWDGFNLALGEKFLFQVTDVSGQNGLIFIRGTLPKGSLLKSKKAKKRKHAADEETDTTDGNVHTVSKKHKKHHLGVSDELKTPGSSGQGQIDVTGVETSSDMSANSRKSGKDMTSETAGFAAVVVEHASKLLNSLTADQKDEVVIADDESVGKSSDTEGHFANTEAVHSSLCSSTETGMHQSSEMKNGTSAEGTDEGITRVKHKKQKKSKRDVNHSVVDEESVINISSKEDGDLDTECNIAEVQFRGATEDLERTPKRHKKNKEFSAELNNSTVSSGSGMVEVQPVKKHKKHKSKESIITDDYIPDGDKCVNDGHQSMAGVLDLTVETGSDLDTPTSSRKHKKKKKKKSSKHKNPQDQYKEIEYL